MEPSTTCEDCDRDLDRCSECSSTRWCQTCKTCYACGLSTSPAIDVGDSEC